MPTCFVPGCNSRTGRQGRVQRRSHFFVPPKDEMLLWQWEKSIGRNDRHLTPKSRVCDAHFSEHLLIKSDKFVINGENTELARSNWKLAPNAVPTLFQTPTAHSPKEAKRKKCPGREARTEKENRAAKSSDEIGEESVVPELVNIADDDFESGDTTGENTAEGESSGILITHVFGNVAESCKKIEEYKRKVRALNKAKNRYKQLRDELQGQVNKYKERERNRKFSSVSELLSGLPKNYKEIVVTMQKEVECRAKVNDKFGMKYSSSYLLMCALFHAKSPEGYMHCKNQQLLPLPAPKTLAILVKGLKRECEQSQKINEHTKTKIQE